MDVDDTDFSGLDGDGDADAGRRARSSGARIYSLFAKQVFDFTWLGSGASTTVTLRRASKLSPYYYYWFGLRIHNREIELATSSLRLLFTATLPSAGAPQEFSVRRGVGHAFLRVDRRTSALKLATANELGPYSKVTMLASQGAGAPPKRLYAKLSAIILAQPS